MVIAMATRTLHVAGYRTRRQSPVGKASGAKIEYQHDEL
jgi:hypothetical protein